MPEPPRESDSSMVINVVVGVLLTLLGLTLLLTSVQAESVKTNPGKSRATSDSTIALRVGDQTVSKQEFNQRVQRAIQRFKQRMKQMKQGRPNGSNSRGAAPKMPSKAMLEKQAKRRVKKQLIEKLLIDHGVNQSNITVADSEVEQQWQRLIQMEGSEKKLRKKIESHPITEKELRTKIRKQLKRRKFILGNTDVSLPTNKEVRDYYKKNKRRFGDKSFSEVRENIKQQLERKRLIKARKKLVKKLRKKTPIESNL